MNPHYHHSPYQEMNSPHSPHSDGVPIGYHSHGHGPPLQCPPPTSNGHMMGGPPRPLHDHLHPHPAFTGGGGGPPVHPDVIPGGMHHHHHHPHHHLHHHMISTSSNTNAIVVGSNSGNSNNNSGISNSNVNSNNNNNNNSLMNGNNGLNNNNNNNNNNSNNNNSNSNNNNNGNAAQNCIGGAAGGIGPNVKICSGCGRKIVERYLLHALDRYWHHCCLKCHCCGTMLADIGSSCFTRNDMILCKADYIRLYGNTGACAACGQTIPASEFVMRVGSGPLASNGMPSSPAGTHHVFHLKCFTCSKCGAPLVSGDRYYLLAGSLVCEQDWHKLLKGTGGNLTTASGTGQQNTNTTGTTTVRKGKVGRPRRTRE